MYYFIDFHVSYPVMIVFAETLIIKGLIRALGKKATPPPFIWIVGDSVWNQNPSKNFMHNYGYIIERGLLVSPKSTTLTGFDEHMKDLFMGSKNAANPWFGEYNTQYSNCNEMTMGTHEVHELKVWDSYIM